MQASLVVHCPWSWAFTVPMQARPLAKQKLSPSEYMALGVPSFMPKMWRRCPQPKKPSGHAWLARRIVIFLINWKALRQSWAPGLQTLPDLLQTTFQLLKATTEGLKWKKCPDSILLCAFQLLPCGHLYTAGKTFNALLSHQGCPAVVYGGDWCWQVCCTKLSYFIRSLSATFQKGWHELIQGKPSQRRKESSFLAFYIQARSKNPHRVHPCHCLPTRSFPLSCCSGLAGEGACHLFWMCLRESQQSCSDAALMLLRCSTSAPEGTALSGAAEQSEPHRENARRREDTE